MRFESKSKKNQLDSMRFESNKNQLIRQDLKATKISWIRQDLKATKNSLILKIEKINTPYKDRMVNLIGKVFQLIKNFISSIKINKKDFIKYVFCIAFQNIMFPHSFFKAMLNERNIYSIPFHCPINRKYYFCSQFLQKSFEYAQVVCIFIKYHFVRLLDVQILSIEQEMEIPFTSKFATYLRKLICSQLPDFTDNLSDQKTIQTVQDYYITGQESSNFNNFIDSSTSNTVQKEKLKSLFSQQSRILRQIKNFLIPHQTTQQFIDNNHQKSLRHDQLQIFILAQGINKKQIHSQSLQFEMNDFKEVFFENHESESYLENLVKQILLKNKKYSEHKDCAKEQILKLVINKRNCLKRVRQIAQKYFQKLRNLSIKQEENAIKQDSKLMKKLIRYLENFDNGPQEKTSFFERIADLLKKKNSTNFKFLKTKQERQKVLSILSDPGKEKLNFNKIQRNLEKSVENFVFKFDKKLLKRMYPPQFYDLDLLLQTSYKDDQGKVFKKKDAKLRKKEKKNRRKNVSSSSSSEKNLNNQSSSEIEEQSLSESLSDENLLSSEQQRSFEKERRTPSKSLEKSDRGEILFQGQTRGRQGKELTKQELQAMLERSFKEKQYSKTRQALRKMKMYHLNGKSTPCVEQIKQKLSEKVKTLQKKSRQYIKQGGEKLNKIKRICNELNNNQLIQLYGLLYNEEKKYPNKKFNCFLTSSLEVEVLRSLYDQMRYKNKESRQSSIKSLPRQTTHQFRRYLDLLELTAIQSNEKDIISHLKKCLQDLRQKNENVIRIHSNGSNYGMQSNEIELSESSSDQNSGAESQALPGKKIKLNPSQICHSEVIEIKREYNKSVSDDRNKTSLSFQNRGSQNSSSKRVQDENKIIEKLKREIKFAETKKGSSKSLEVLLRKLHLAVLNNNMQEIKDLCEKIKSMSIRYGFAEDTTCNLQEISRQNSDKKQRTKEVRLLRNKIEPLNLLDIALSNSHMQEAADSCKNESAVILIGDSGVGKTTCFHGFSGHPLFYCPDTKDYRCSNPTLASKYQIGNTMDSQTTECSSIEIPKRLKPVKYQNIKVKVIDTPGLNDNREGEQDIKNVLGTIQVINQLKSGWFLIFISRKQLQADKQYRPVKQLIISLSRYFVNLDSCTRSISFVLTKGLRKSQLLEILDNFEDSDNYQRQNWLPKEKEVLKFIKKKILNQLSEDQEISNPVRHDYEELIKRVLQKNPVQKPGQYLSSSFSQDSNQKMQKAASFYYRMVIKAFQFGEFDLTFYYLKIIEFLDKIRTTRIYKSCLQELKKMFDAKVKEFEFSLNKFIEYEIEQNLQAMNVIRALMNQANANDLYEQLSLNGYSNPLESLQLSLMTALNEGKRQFENASNIPKPQRKKALRYLRLIKKFRPIDQYDDIVQKIKNKNERSKNRIEQRLLQQHFNKEQWNQQVNTFTNQFTIDENMLTEDQRYRVIKKLVQSHYASHPEEVSTIIQLLENSKTQTLDDSLRQTCSQFFKKIQTLQQTHYLIKESLESKIKDTIKKLNQTIIFYEEQQDFSVANSDHKNIDKLHIYQQNKDQINKILIQFDPSTFHQFKIKKGKESTIQKILAKLREFCSNLEKSMTQLSTNDDNIDPTDVNLYLSKIFGLKKIITKIITERIQTVSNNQMQNNSAILISMKEHNSTADNTIKKIIIRMNKIVISSSISRYQINYKLINCLLIIKQFGQFVSALQNSLIESINSIEKEIVRNLMAPLEEIKSFEFDFKSDFQTLSIVLKYLKDLDVKALQLGQKADGFCFMIKFAENNQIENVLKKCFDKVKDQSQQFTPIVKLSEFNARLQYESDSEQLRTQQEQYLRALTYDLLHKAVRYIGSFKHIKTIVTQFNEIKIIKDFNKSGLQEEYDLKNIVIKRMSTITNDIQNPQFNGQNNKEELVKIDRQFNFLFDILEMVREQNDRVFVDSKKKIGSLLAQFMLDFKNQYESAKLKYKQVHHGVDYTSLEELIAHSSLKDGNNKILVKNLLGGIHKQYEHHLNQIAISLDDAQNIEARIKTFLNIYQFQKICSKMQYPFSLKLQLLQLGLKQLFDIIFRKFQFMISQKQKGSRLEDNLVKQWKTYERRILVNPLLQSQYKRYRQQNKKPARLQQLFDQKMVEIQKTFYQKYQTSFEIDEKVKKIYESSDENRKIKMMKAAITAQSNKIKQFQILFNNDQDNFKTQLALRRQLIDDYCPNQIKQEISKHYNQLEQKFNKYETDFQTKIHKSIEKKDPESILSEYITAKNKKNTQATIVTKNALKTYFCEEIRSINFQNSTLLKQNIQKNIKFINNPNFQNIPNSQAQIKNLENQYIENLKKCMKSFIQSAIHDFTDFKRQLAQINPEVSFQLYNFKTIQTDIFTKIKQIAQVTQPYKFLAQQNQTIIQFIQDNYQKERMIIEANLLKIQELITKISLKEQISKQELIQAIRNCEMSKLVYQQMYDQLKQVSFFGALHGDKATIQDYDTVILDLKQIFSRKHMQMSNWNFENCLFNDSPEQMMKRFMQISTDLKLISNFGSILFQNEEIPYDCLDQIQKKNLSQFMTFKEKTNQQITDAFKTHQQCQCQNVRKYYNAIDLFKLAHFLVFPANFNAGTQVQNQIVNCFKKNTSKLMNFSQNQKFIAEFKDMIKQLSNSQAVEKDRIKSETQKNQANKLKFLKQYEKSLEDEIRLIPDDEKKESTKIKKIKQFQGIKSPKINDLDNKLKELNKTICEQFKNQRSKITSKIISFVDSEFVMNLVINRQARSVFNCQPQVREQRRSISTILEKVLIAYQPKITNYIYKSLQMNENTYSKSIISECNHFNRYKSLQFKQKTKGQTFEKLLDKIEELKNNQRAKKNLTYRYKKYLETFYRLLQQYKNSPQRSSDALTKIIIQTKHKGQQLKKQYFQDIDSNVQRQELVAYVFAIWTIHKAIKDDNGSVQFTYQPHPGQVITIFLILNLDATNPTNDIEKCMVQVSTGEGKSVILGVLSTYLALVGFNVYEACYSQYLSQRDYKDFENLFNCLKIHDKISYNIFPEICKLMLDESPQNPFTKKIHDFVITPNIWTKIGNYFSKLLPDNKKKSSILLIDEADVFLDEKYLGKSYFPTICIKNEPFKVFLEKVWTLRDRSASLKPQDIIKLKEFEDMCKQVNNKIFVQIMQNQTNAMIRDLNSYKNDNYTVQNGRIFYKEGDGLSDKIHYGYRTIWAYFHENSINKKVSVNDLASQLFNNLIVAGFSYSKLPFYFRTILGVTGTLESMSNGQKSILKREFQVKKMYVQPSIYDRSNRVVTFKKCYNGKIYDLIINNIQQKHNQKIPVIVFFRTKNQIYDFFDYFSKSQSFSRYKSDTSIVTYEVKPEDRDYRIQLSTHQGKITLITDDFSRGTDFKHKPKDPKTHPGLHIISSFLPTSYSDYIQLAGRTARQGENGSVFIVIGSQKELSQSQSLITREQAELMIKQIDAKTWETKAQELKDKIQSANTQHEKNMKLYSSGSTVDQIFQNIKELNHEPPIMSYNSKTAICIDATGSMGSVLPKVKQVVQGAIPDIYKAIELEKVQGSFELKIIIYRNYSSGAQLLLQTTNFETKSEPLVNWLSGIKVNGGQGNEAIEVCFQHINNLEEIHQCVIIGDAQANTSAETVSNRKCNTEAFWNNNGFPLTNFDAEVQKLKQKKIKVHSYYLKPSSTANFYKKLSQDTSGVSEQFKINDEDATKKFADFVANRIISSLGQMVGGDAGERMRKRYIEVSSKKRYI